MSVRVGLVSFAHVHAPHYAAVLAALDAADFVGIADDDARGREAAGGSASASSTKRGRFSTR